MQGYETAEAGRDDHRVASENVVPLQPYPSDDPSKRHSHCDESQQTASVVPLAALRDGMGTRVGAVHYALIFRSIALKRFFMYACDDVDTPWHLM